MEAHKNRLYMLLDVEEEAASGGLEHTRERGNVSTCVVIFQPFLPFFAVTVAGFGGKMVNADLECYC